MNNDDRNYDSNEIEVDERFVSSRKEMIYTFAVQITYTLLMLLVAYIFGKGDPSQYRYVLGMPQWWFLCLAITAVYIVVIYILTHKVYKDVDVSAYIDENAKEVK